LVVNETYYDSLGHAGESSGFITSEGEIALLGDVRYPEQTINILVFCEQPSSSLIWVALPGVGRMQMKRPE